MGMKQQKLYEQIEKVLSEEIAEGIYKPGDALPPERELMERFDVGRPSVREALFSLSKRGLVEMGSGRRPRVLEPSFDTIIGELDVIVRQVLNNPSNIAHLMELRRILECALARKLASEVSDEEIKELKAKLDENQNALGNLDRFWATDSEFHSMIARMSGNPVLPTIVDVILRWLIENRRVTLSAPGSDKTAFRAHQEIFKGISTRNPDLAEESMKKHLLSVEKRVKKALQS
ncbi:FCD domain-containing protein [Ruegeria sp. HKCCD8929]|uniref:FCD domain-containing protein n=1 Tax=Ruegeria sp. HKCCD8929 TaxID=2683006 RepID=UPI0014884754|nr:FCD domain-containing protein [Ruegeria sp. HKCCD8929]